MFCFRNDDIKKGVCVGEDKYGNKYFQNNFYFMGKYPCFPNASRNSSRKFLKDFNRLQIKNIQLTF